MSIMRAFTKIKIHLFCLILLFGITLAYMWPQLEGQIIAGGDVVSSTAWSHQVIEYEEISGIKSNWNPSMFSGMPWGLLSLGHQYNVLRFVDEFSKLWTSPPLGLLFKTGILGYFALILVRIHPLLALLGGLSLALNLNYTILLEAGHQSKVNVLSNFPMIISGVLLCFNGRWRLGSAIIAVFSSIAISNNHIQMVYYLLLTLVVFGICYMSFEIKEKMAKRFFIGALIALMAAAFGGLSNYSRLASSQSFSEDTMRGNAILTVSENNSESSSETDGLAWNYAMQWSNGWKDLGSFLIPRLVGGSSYEEVSAKSPIGKVLKNNGSNRGRDGHYQAPMYWGGLPFTSGPYYSSMIYFFLMILGFFVLDKKFWVAFFAATVFLLLLSMGQNFQILNKGLFDYLPLFSKFRAPSSAVTIIPTFLVFVGVSTANVVVSQANIKNSKQLLLPIGISFGAIVLMGIIGGFSFNFEGIGDGRYSAEIAKLFVETRESLFYSDLFRALTMLTLVVLLFVTYYKKMIKKNWLFMGLLIIVFLIDIFPVNRRHLDIDNWESRRKYNNQFALTNTDEQILSMEPNGRAYYRVMDIPNMQSAIGSYHHNTIGGYHAAKLQRYQDMLDYHVYKGNAAAINMLNAKYVINQEGKVNINKNALGNVWCVDEIITVNSANEEIEALSGEFDPKRQAVVNRVDFPDIEAETIKNSSCQAELVEATPNYWKYNFNSDSKSVLVFSEVWYPKKKGLIAYIDGEEASFFRVNYILRAMSIPNGNHIIEFKFEPKPKGKMISFISSILIFIWLMLNLLPESIKSKIPIIFA